MSGQSSERLGSWLERAARAAGHGGLWRAYASGRLGMPIDDWRLSRLAESPTPRDRAQCDALAADFGIDPVVLWWVVEEGAGNLTAAR